MPFKSEKQRRWMWANDPEMAAKWEKKSKKESEVEYHTWPDDPEPHPVRKKHMKETKKKRDYKKEYEKYGKSKKAKKYRAELNKYNRQKGTYGNGDGKDASHKGGKIVGFEDQSKNRGRREKSRLKKENTIGRNKMAKKKVKETSKKSKVAQIKLFDLLPEEEKSKINQIMDDIDITDERVMSKFSPVIKEYEKSLQGFTAISEFLKYSDKKLHGKMSKVAETIEEINAHLEGIIGKIK